VLDTNVLVSGLLWTGPSQQILDAAEQRRVVLVSCPSLLDELADVLGRPKLARRLALLGTTADQLFALALGQLEIINEPAFELVVTADPDDDVVVTCALAGNARYIVSGDRHLLDLKDYKGISILRPAETLAKLQLPPQSAKP
jgi:uncharacterized protein